MNMPYRRLGRSGLLVSPLALGTDNFTNPTPKDESIRLVDAALDAGINLIDTSNSYAAGEAERIIGEALRRSGRRDQAIIATKVHYPTGPGPNDRGNSRRHILQACDESLRRLQVDYIDLYQLHRPDFGVPVEETLSALTDLVRLGKVRYIGSSTAPAWHVVEAVMTSRQHGFEAFISEQSPYNLLDRRVENEMLPACTRFGLGVLAWSPLAMGILAGRYTAPDKRPADSCAAVRGGIYAERVGERGIAAGNRFAALAIEHGYQPAQLALAFLLKQPAIAAALTGPKNVDQMMTLIDAASVEVSIDIETLIDDLLPPGSAVANFFNSAPWMKNVRGSTTIEPR